ncbi:hypothetical protein CRENBAI_003948 [Crenichthys baileyi]|uniref:Uncharacterized protein n=1 Tax=Crenichthys baileyi TaxID=28760 RepID=A0AAV9S842_9TELE
MTRPGPLLEDDDNFFTFETAVTTTIKYFCPPLPRQHQLQASLSQYLESAAHTDEAQAHWAQQSLHQPPVVFCHDPPLLWYIQTYRDSSDFLSSFARCRSPYILPATRVANGRQGSTHFTTSSNRGASICCLPVSTQHGVSHSVLFLDSRTTHQRQRPWVHQRRNQFGEHHQLLQELHLDNGRLQLYFRLSRTQFEDLLSHVRNESASGTQTTGAVSPPQNACPSVFGENKVQAGDHEVVPSRHRVQAGDQEVIPSRHRVQAGDREVVPSRDRVQAGDREVVPSRHRVQAGDQEVIPSRHRVQAGDKELVPSSHRVQEQGPVALLPRIPRLWVQKPERGQHSQWHEQELRRRRDPQWREQRLKRHQDPRRIEPRHASYDVLCGVWRRLRQTWGQASSQAVPALGPLRNMARKWRQPALGLLRNMARKWRPPAFGLLRNMARKWRQPALGPLQNMSRKLRQPALGLLRNMARTWRQPALEHGEEVEAAHPRAPPETLQQAVDLAWTVLQQQQQFGDMMCAELQQLSGDMTWTELQQLSRDMMWAALQQRSCELVWVKKDGKHRTEDGMGGAAASLGDIAVADEDAGLLAAGSLGDSAVADEDAGLLPAALTSADRETTSSPVDRLGTPTRQRFLRRQEEDGLAAGTEAGGECRSGGGGTEQPSRTLWRWAASRSICSSSSGEGRTSK